MSCTTTANAQTGNTKYIYGQDGTNTTVYTLNEDGKTLTRKLKYEYKHDENGQVIEKKAYRWDAYRELWKPAYLLTVTPGAYETKTQLCRMERQGKRLQQQTTKLFTVKTTT